MSLCNVVLRECGCCALILLLSTVKDISILNGYCWNCIYNYIMSLFMILFFMHHASNYWVEYCIRHTIKNIAYFLGKINFNIYFILNKNVSKVTNEANTGIYRALTLTSKVILRGWFSILFFKELTKKVKTRGLTTIYVKWGKNLH